MLIEKQQQINSTNPLYLHSFLLFYQGITITDIKMLHWFCIKEEQSKTYCLYYTIEIKKQGISTVIYIRYWAR